MAREDDAVHGPLIIQNLASNMHNHRYRIKIIDPSDLTCGCEKGEQFVLRISETLG